MELGNGWREVLRIQHTLKLWNGLTSLSKVLKIHSSSDTSNIFLEPKATSEMVLNTIHILL